MGLNVVFWYNMYCIQKTKDRREAQEIEDEEKDCDLGAELGSRVS